MQSVPVALGARSYTIEIGAGLIASGRAAEIVASVAPGKRVCLVTHPGLRSSYADPLAEGLSSRGFTVHTATIPAGERVKTLNTVARLYSEFIQAKLDRKGLVIAVGGGVLGDIVGFAAASFMRGIAFVQVPTTLLAQVDASVGGKTGVDLPEGKNLVGAFHQPVSVIIDTETLSTLPARELRAGLAEIIKYGIIYDSLFFEETMQGMPALLRRDPSALSHVIARSCEIKAEVVAQDETEQGLRAILNFGHTVGHAVEAVTNYRRYKHGEAVAIGMVTACLIGEERGLTPPAVTAAVTDALQKARLPVGFPADIEAEAVLEAAQRDKKTEAGQLRFVLAHSVGTVAFGQSVDSGTVCKAIARQKQRG